MTNNRRIRDVAVACVLAFCTFQAFAQNYPTRPVRIVTGDAGGSSDFFLRLLSQELAGPLGQPIIVDNRTGSAVIPGEIVSKAAPDGYTLLYLGSNFWIVPLLQKTIYDPLKDFAPVTITTRACSVLVVTPSLPVSSVKDLIVLANAKPGELNYAHGNTGSASHLSGSMFKAMTGVNVVAIPYKGTAQALTDVMAGQAQLMFPNAAAVTPFIKAGRLKALAVTCAQPSGLMPGLPTVAATVPGFQFGSMTGMFAPARTPEAVIRRLNQEVVRFVNGASIKERLAGAGVESVGSSPQELASLMRTETVLWRKIIKDVGIKAD